MKKVYLAAVAAFAAMLATGAIHAQPAEPSPQSVACAKLMNQKISASDIGLKTNGAVIQLAELKAPKPMTVDEKHQPRFGAPLTYGVDPALPEYCEVKGFIASVDPAAPPINFQINLPTNWNNKAMQYGGGGMDGTVINGLEGRFPSPPTAPVPLMRGYVTFGSDSGHCCGGNTSFALNDEAFRNFAHEQLKKTHDVAVAIVKLRYGKAPERMYFAGNSEGGREAVTVVQRYGKDYDGVIATGPVLNFTGLSMKQNYIRGYMARGGWMDKAKIDLVGKAAYDACDALDGAKDEIISAWRKCTPERASVAKLRCPGGKDTGDTCLSDAQIEMVNVIRRPLKFPFPLAHGVTEYAGYAIGGEAQFNQWEGWMLGRKAPTLPTPIGNERVNGTSTIPHYGASFVRYTLGQDPTFEPLDFDKKMEQYKDRLMYVSEQVSSANPDLSEFAAAGHKLLLKANTADYAQSAFADMAYYDSVVKKMGQAKADSFLRFYVAPGAAHFGGYAPESVDLIEVLENWVEKGQAPGELKAAEYDFVGTKVLRTRPLCVYPKYPKYKGSGDMNDAANFSCATQ